MENGEVTETTWEYNVLSKPMVVHIDKSDYMRPKVRVGHTHVSYTHLDVYKRQDGPQVQEHELR